MNLLKVTNSSAFNRANLQQQLTQKIKAAMKSPVVQVSDKAGLIQAESPTQANQVQFLPMLFGNHYHKGIHVSLSLPQPQAVRFPGDILTHLQLITEATAP